jgi:uncharacterized protein (TIGR02246 family)
MKYLLLLTLLLLQAVGHAQSKDEKAIRKLLDDQARAWSRGDVEGYMQGYWKSDSLMFIGKSGIHLSWQETLANYKKNYPDKAAMGKLNFDIIQVRRLSADYYYVVGKWMLTRSMGDLGGYYDLLLHKIKGQWYIVADHSS